MRYPNLRWYAIIEIQNKSGRLGKRGKCKYLHINTESYANIPHNDVRDGNRRIHLVNCYI